MKIYKIEDFNEGYLKIINDLLNNPMYRIKNKNGEILHEITNFNLVLTNLDKIYCNCRNLNLHYLIGELLFYLKGENKLENIEYYSNFWKKCSDDGVNLNSCYGYYIWTQKIKEDKNQFEYAKKQLLNNSESKKSIITIYFGGWHSYQTKDNPCTMFLQFYIRNNRLNMKTHMRSNDIWYGIPYDLPFFVMVQKMLLFELKSYEKFKDLELGEYIHTANSLHLYEKNFKNVIDVLKKPFKNINVPKFTPESYSNLINLFKLENELKKLKDTSIYNYNYLKGNKVINLCDSDKFISFFKKLMIMNKLFNDLKFFAKNFTTCLKKEVACIIISEKNEIVSFGYNGRPNKMDKCQECVVKKEEFFHDTCNSLHSEERAILKALKKGKEKELKNSICYITHAPCDQCLKFLVELGIKKVVFKESYKTHFERYKGFIEIEDFNGRIYI